MAILSLIKTAEQKSWTPHELCIGDKIVGDPHIIRQAFYEHYKGLAQIKKDPSFDVEFMNTIYQNVSDTCMYSLSKQNCNRIGETHINNNEVKVALQKMKTRKVPGFDGIVMEHIKLAEDILLPHLVKLFNAIMNAEHYPQQF
jgi:hypothetical protein